MLSWRVNSSFSSVNSFAPILFTGTSHLLVSLFLASFATRTWIPEQPKRAVKLLFDYAVALLFPGISELVVVIYWLKNRRIS
jgi:hypothetical protein